MIDLHCHLLPGIDDGAPDLETALAMARLAVDDGITITACTPHNHPGVYDNHGPAIKVAVADLQGELDRQGIALRLVVGSDVHIAEDLVDGLKCGRVASLNNTRYFLFEPPHHVAPPRMEALVFDLMLADYAPILTHPERLTWIEDHYDAIVRLAGRGVLMQITAGSLTGRFGKRPKYWADRMLEEGLVHILATDAHNLRNRKPILSEARDLVGDILGEEEATMMVLTRPARILDDMPSIAAERKAPHSPARRRSAFRPLAWLGLQ